MVIRFNSLAPGKCEWNFRYVIFKQISVIDGWGISCEIALIWMSFDFADDRSTLVQVMVWCRQATSHYLSQCWHRSMSPYGVTRPQWVNSLWPSRVIPYGDIDLGPHWLRQWLVAWWHRAITWTNVDLSSWMFCSIHLRANIQEVLMNLFHNMSLEIMLLSHWGLVTPFGDIDLVQHWPDGIKPLPEPMLTYHK